MKKGICFLLFLSFAVISEAQTKRIAHRSHSGDDASFQWQQGRDNFGETPEMKKERLARADSVRRRLIADSLAKIATMDSTQRRKDSAAVKKPATRNR